MKQFLFTTSCIIAFTALAGSAHAQIGNTVGDVTTTTTTALTKDGDEAIALAAKNFTIKDGNVVNTRGDFVAKYDPATKLYIGAGGKPINATIEQELFKQVYKNNGTPVDTLKVATAAPTVTATPGAAAPTLDPAKTYTIKDGVVRDDTGKTIAKIDLAGAGADPSKTYTIKDGKVKDDTGAVITTLKTAAGAATDIDPKILEAAKNYTVNPNGVIVNKDGKTVARFDAAKGEYLDMNGKAITSSVEKAIFKEVFKTANKENATTTNTLKSIGEGFIVDSKGNIFKEGKAIAKLVDSGKLVNLDGKELAGDLESKLGGLMKGIKLPIGFGGDDRSDSRIIQKNTYVAATDDGDVYYGGSGTGASGGIDIDVGKIIKAADDKGGTTTPTTPATPAAGYTIVGDGVIKSPDGASMGRYVAATNTYYDMEGNKLTGGKQYDLLKAAVTMAKAGTAPTTTTTTAATPGVITEYR